MTSEGLGIQFNNSIQLVFTESPPQAKQNAAVQNYLRDNTNFRIFFDLLFLIFKNYPEVINNIIIYSKYRTKDYLLKM